MGTIREEAVVAWPLADLTPVECTPPAAIGPPRRVAGSAPMGDDRPVVSIRPLSDDEAELVDVVARRMRLTLVEVLGAERADAMSTHDELVGRVRWHLDRSAGRRATVLVAHEGATMTGHALVRVDDHLGAEVGLFATTYVTPEHRRRGAASALLEAGETWMTDQGMTTVMTYTDPGNEPLLAWYRARGYRIEVLDDDWARARRELATPSVDDRRGAG